MARSMQWLVWSEKLHRKTIKWPMFIYISTDRFRHFQPEWLVHAIGQAMKTELQTSNFAATSCLRIIRTALAKTAACCGQVGEYKTFGFTEAIKSERYSTGLCATTIKQRHNPNPAENKRLWVFARPKISKYPNRFSDSRLNIPPVPTSWEIWLNGCQ